MSERTAGVLVVAAAVAAACSSPGKSPAGQGDPATVASDSSSYADADADAEIAPMNPRLRTGPIPANLDPRLAARDLSPLPPDALVKFQSIGRLSPATNYRYVLARDGGLFFAAHTGTNTDGRVLFDTPLPASPTRIVPARRVATVEQALRKHGFVDQPPYQLDPQVEDGSIYVVTARIDGREHEVIYEAFAPPLVGLLETLRTP